MRQSLEAHRCTDGRTRACWRADDAKPFYGAWRGETPQYALMKLIHEISHTWSRSETVEDDAILQLSSRQTKDTATNESAVNVKESHPKGRNKIQ